MRQLINLCATPKPGHLLEDWNQAQELITELGLDGFEISTYGRFAARAIPKSLISGVHLNFYPQFYLLWQNDTDGLLKRFGDWDTVQQMFGCRDAEGLVANYRWQLDLAEDLSAEYVVFHPALVDGDGIFTQQFDWHWRDSLKICAELLNAALAGSRFRGKLLMENLWWQGSFRLDSRAEYDYLKRLVDYDNVGICFDSGHRMACDWQLTSQQAGIDAMLGWLSRLDLYDEIHTLHLNASLGGHNLTPGRSIPHLDNEHWARLGQILQHVTAVDPHLPFDCGAVRKLVDAVQPSILVHELAQPDKPTWLAHIACQRSALAAAKNDIELTIKETP